MRENTIKYGENIYSACFSVTSIASFTSIWFRRDKIAMHMDILADFKISRLQLCQMFAFHVLIAVYATLYIYMSIAWYMNILIHCAVDDFIKVMISIVLYWNGVCYVVPILLLLNSSFLHRLKFKALNKCLMQYLDGSTSKTSSKNLKIKVLRDIRSNYINLRNTQEQRAFMLNISVISNHLFMLIYFINVMLYLIVSIMENNDRSPYVIGVLTAFIGLVIIFVEASFLEMEANEVGTHCRLFSKTLIVQ